MGIVERKEREKQRRREEILDAAEKIFFSKGIQNATMDDVAETAELSKGTLYLYFKSKEELYLAISLRGMAIMEQMFDKAVEKHKTGLEKVHAIGKAYFDFYKRYPDYMNAFLYYESHELNFEEEGSVACECDGYGHRALDIVVEALNIGIQDGTVRKDVDPFKTSAVLWGFCTGIIQLFSLKGDHLKKEHRFEDNQ